MTAADDLKAKAEILGWTYHAPIPFQAVLVRGDKTVQVRYTAAGSIAEAELYRFYRVGDLHLLETADGSYKREKVVAWLAGD